MGFFNDSISILKPEIMDSKRKETVVIVGFGWVGQANALSLSQAGYDVSYFDPGEPTRKYEDGHKEGYERLSRLKNVLEKDSSDTWYMVCVGDRVLPSGEQDISLIRKALESLRGAKGGIILRSTIVPGHLASLDFDFYVPEFLHEKKAVEECMNPHYFILGKRGGKEGPSFFRVWERRAVKTFVGTPEEASYLKYLSNIWNALRIAFVNEFGDAIALPVDKGSLQRTERLVDFFFERKAYLRYGKAYDGHCLPKDTHAFLTWHKKQGRDVSLLEGMHVSNIAHKELASKYPHMPEWYSEWVRPEIGGYAALKAFVASVKRNVKKALKL
jgi:UDP-glucose 6-dehydrogenase